MSSARYLLVPLGAGIPAALLLGIYAVLGGGTGGIGQRAAAPPVVAEAEVSERRTEPQDRAVPEPSPLPQAAPAPTRESHLEPVPKADQGQPPIEIAQAQMPAAPQQRGPAPAAPSPATPSPPPASPSAVPAVPPQTAPTSSAAPAVSPQTAPQAVPAGRQAFQIERNNLLYLVRSTLLALHQANETGNYSVLRDMSAPGFQTANNLARLSDIFANLRAQKLDLAPVSILDPQVTSLPSVDANNHLLIEGAYPQIPPGVNFRLLFVAVEGRWRLQGIAINLGQNTAAAPVQQQPAPGSMPAQQQPASGPVPAQRPAGASPASAGAGVPPAARSAEPTPPRNRATVP